MNYRMLLVTLATVGCASAPKSRLVARADLAHGERTRMTGYVGDWTGWIESTPGQVPRTAVMDEAFLTADAQRICAVLTMRTNLDNDDALSQWAAKVNGYEVYAEDERVAVADYTIHGERVVVDAAYMTPFIAGRVQITKPTADIWRVVERTARFCQVTQQDFALELSLQRRHSDPARVLEFNWKVL